MSSTSKRAMWQPTSGSSDQRIFVQVAAYRDPELLPTLRDCIAQADQPDQLTFGICWQRAEDESLGEFADMPNVRFIDVHYSRARGTCWARSETQALYRDEPFTLQIDSHHRFVQGWDTRAKALFSLARQRGAQKPLLTSYAPEYAPEFDPVGRGDNPLRLVFDGFSPGGPFQVLPVAMSNAQKGSRLERARFLSGHFLFTAGEFCREVPYDPRLYFFGEEPAMAIRAFTHGYDLFHPRDILLWHHYGRAKAPRHWTDNRRWWLRNERSLQQYRRLITSAVGTHDMGAFGLGGVRTLVEYEAYAGVALQARAVTRRALRGESPLHPRLAQWLPARRRPEQVVKLSLAELPATFGRAPGDSLYVGIHDLRQREIIRRDLVGEQLLSALEAGSYTLRFHAAAGKAVGWTLWTWQPDGGWGHRVQGAVGYPH